MSRAAQLLADATLVRRGEPPRGLSTMTVDEREWFKQAARQIVELFELLTSDAPPLAQVQAEARAREESRLRAETARDRRLAIERQRGAVVAAERGHDIRPWFAHGEELGQGREQACCHRCRRLAFIDLAKDPALSGPALTEGCLTAAGEERS
jgi:hypothetical protein